MKPGLSEITAYIPMYIILVLLIQLFQSMSVKNKVQKTSRCYQLKYSTKVPTSVSVKSINGDPLYNIKYDIAKKTMSLDCACPVGETVNTFNNIKLYNFATHASEYGHLTCPCDSQYSNINNDVVDENSLIAGNNYIIDAIKNAIFQLVILNESQNNQLIEFLNNNIKLSYKPGLFDVTKFINEMTTIQQSILGLTSESVSNIINLINIIVSHVIDGNIDITLKSSIKNNVIANNPNLTQPELNIIFIILDTLDNNVINKGNNVIEYTNTITFPTDTSHVVKMSNLWKPEVSQEFKNRYSDIEKLIIKLYTNADFTYTNSSNKYVFRKNIEGSILQSENSKDYMYEGNPDIIRYIESNDMNIFERNIVSDV